MRFFVAMLAAVMLLTVDTPADHAAITAAEYQARRAAVADVYDRTRPFEAGMVFTMEPGVYVRKDDILASDVFKKLPASEQASIRTAVDRYDGIGVRIEDDVLITAAEPRILSAGAPRSARDIEAHMANKQVIR